MTANVSVSTDGRDSVRDSIERDAVEPHIEPPVERMPQNAPECPSPENALNDKQRLAIDLIILGRGYGDIAHSIGVDRKTLYRWRMDAPFVEALDELRRLVWSAAADRLTAMVEPAIDILHENLTDRHERRRFRGATAILRLADLRKEIAHLNGNNRR